MGRSEFGNDMDRGITHNTVDRGIIHNPDNDLDMLDDLERAKHYKTNIMQDFNDRQSSYSSRYAKSKKINTKINNFLVVFIMVKI